MKLAAVIAQRAHHLNPSCFALVMATGIVSIDVNQHGMRWLALALLGVNMLAWLALLAMSGWRLLRFRHELIADFIDPGRGAGFLTLSASACVLGTQFLLVVHLPVVARVLALIGALTWAALLYLFFAAAITARIKPRFTRSINGGWLVAVVATQALAVLMVLLVAEQPDISPGWLFGALCLYLLGAGLYLLIITLVVYRLVFFPLRAREFTPPYWINMGALAITTLAGSRFVLLEPAGGLLADLVPFVKGFTLFFWAMATWWIPLLILLELWRYVARHTMPLYESDDWNIVFPLGMYTVGTFELAHALHLDFLTRIPAIGVYISLLVWAVVAAATLQRWYRDLAGNGKQPERAR